MCLVEQVGCGCVGHRWPGVHHIKACCDQPHIDQKIFLENRGVTDPAAPISAVAPTTPKEGTWPVSVEAPSGPVEAAPTSLA